jgi:glutathione synthase/RimK-type ligase-like ATP-grasp enzyme
MKTYDITLLTAQHYLDPADPDWYVQQILHEDLLLREALERKGLRVHRIDWTNKEFDWSSTGTVLFRAVWDYTERYDEFIRFLHAVSARTTMINPLKIILWNLDKHYLHDLEKLGVNIPETTYIEKNTSTSLQHLYSIQGSRESIIKPVMSAGARHTYRLNGNNLSQHESIFQQLVAVEAMMMQPFLHSVTTHGEKTLVVIGGKFTHAVIKKAKPGDFRVQDDFGGTVHHYIPTNEEIAFAERTVSACVPIPLYGRVDILRDNNDQLAVSELELIEPELWFRFHPPAAQLLAEEIVKII